VHLITVDRAYRLLLSTQFIGGDEPWTDPRFRLQLRTNLDPGVILDFRDVKSLQFLASATRGLLAAHRAHSARPKRVDRPTALHFDCF